MPPMLTTSGILLLVGQLLEVMVDVVAAGHRAAGRIDPQTTALHVVVVAHLIDLVFDVAFVAQDRALDRE